MMLDDIKTITINQNKFVKSFKGKKCTFKPTDDHNEYYGYYIGNSVLASDYFGTIWTPDKETYSIEGNFYTNDHKLVYIVTGEFYYQIYQSQGEVTRWTLRLLVYGDKINIINE